MLRRVAALAAAGFLVIAAAGPAPAREERRSFTIAATGDVIVHEAIAAAARTPGGGFDFTPLLAPVEPWIAAADLAICHLEVPLSPDNTRLAYQDGDEHPAIFTAPRETAAALAATGYDACSTAGNHALDAGFDGIVGTLDVLDAAGIAHAGTARTPEERLPTLLEVEGVAVGFIAATITPNVGWPGPDLAWAVNRLDAATILADAAWARDRGAEFVIVSLHWGMEYEVGPAGWQRDLALQLLPSPDVDVILGHHTHVVSPIEWIDGEVVVYGMGNHISNIRGLADGTKIGSEDGIIVHLEVVERADGGFGVAEVSYTTTWVDPTTKRVLPALDTLRTDPAAPAWGLEAALARSEQRIGLLASDAARHSEDPWSALTCGGRRATIVGSPGRDVLVGTPGDDVIVGRGGGDAIWGLDGADVICGGDGDDALHGGDGPDLIHGDGGDDAIGGDGGHDLIRGGDGDDVLGGGVGNDTLLGGDGDDLLRGGHGDDRLVSGWGTDLLDGGPGDDVADAWHPSTAFRGGGEDLCRVSGSQIDCS